MMINNVSAQLKAILVMVVFIADASLGRAQTITPVFSFHGNDGGYGTTALVQGRDGNLYGTTAILGTSDFGTIFKITPDGQHTLIHNFTGGEGYFPSGLVLGTNGRFYGTAGGGGSAHQGTIFTFGATGNVSDLPRFPGNEGTNPPGPFVLGTGAKFYGGAQLGGPAQPWTG